ncbi:alpha/beta hydrolase fold protein [Salinarchaeum sp. Harcht-Bsk1]|uniref:alpha/beta fold hydrolase n=1 Tax=Salinarchaeum sp. Harcht-Bsk1 TaxID=1333523 RepID=UPI0003423019|nr:alpha/beta hydrolase [Salinarchaeum sp. Harcht-Bsk1]AGN01439.1 alpha/beta hydrolase fold protein [Salinarchaeum sp. Harcht-Bsk1]
MDPEEPEPLPEGWTEGTVRSNGIDVHYTRTNDGTSDDPPFVICHGVFDDGPCRTPLAREFADEFDVVLVDARGHGRSDAPAEGYAMAERVADLGGVIEALELADPILFGHSMGGDTVAATAAAHPDLPRAVVMEDPAGMLAHEESPEELAAWASDRIEFWHGHSKAELLDADEEISSYVADGRAELARRLADARLRVSARISAVFASGWVDTGETYSEIRVPTLILKADGDDAERERNREHASHLPDVELVHVDGTGHTVFRDDRETATKELRAFLDGLVE